MLKETRKTIMTKIILRRLLLLFTILPFFAKAETVDIGMEVTPGCQVAPFGKMNFGSNQFIDDNIVIQGTIEIRCQLGVNYTYHFKGSNDGERFLQPLDPTTNLPIRYFLSRNSNGSGVINPINPVSSVGTGDWQTHTFFGRLPSQITPKPGQYKDLIEVVVTL